MNAIGIDLTARHARAVSVDGEGAVQRATAVTGQSPRSSAREAALFVAASGSERVEDPLGVAADPAERAAADGMLRDVAASHGLLVNPGAAAVVAEAWVGGAKGARNVVCLWVGERVLAGVLLNGEPWRGSHGLAGSAAWLALNPVERQDYRKFGSLAAEVNDQGIARRLAWRIQAGDESAVLAKVGRIEEITAADVFQGAREADGVAISVVKDTAKYIGMAAANLAAAIDPDVVVIGGPITSARDLLLDAVRQEFARRLLPALAEQLVCEFSPLGEDGMAIGAARMAMMSRG